MKRPRTPGRVASVAVRRVMSFAACGSRAENRRSLPALESLYQERISGMTTFDEREKAFESKFAHDEELRFKSTVRRNRLIGLWAAEKLGLPGAEAEAYARIHRQGRFPAAGRRGRARQSSRADLAAKGVDVSDHEIAAHADRKAGRGRAPDRSGQRQGLAMSDAMRAAVPSAPSSPAASRCSTPG